MVTVVLGKNDLNQRFGPWMFETHPDDQTLEAFLRKECPTQFFDPEDGIVGPGAFGGFIYLKIYQCVMK